MSWQAGTQFVAGEEQDRWWICTRNPTSDQTGRWLNWFNFTNCSQHSYIHLSLQPTIMVKTEQIIHWFLLLLLLTMLRMDASHEVALGDIWAELYRQGEEFKHLDGTRRRDAAPRHQQKPIELVCLSSASSKSHSGHIHLSEIPKRVSPGLDYISLLARKRCWWQRELPSATVSSDRLEKMDGLVDGGNYC